MASTTAASICKSNAKPVHHSTRRISNPIAIATYTNENCSNGYSSSTDSSCDGKDILGVGFTARSLPPPRAPHLCSRGITRDRFSRIPRMELPESAATSTTTASTSYGSLRDSWFYNHDNRAESSYSFNNFCPQSLPTHMSMRGCLSAEEWAGNKYSNEDSIPCDMQEDDIIHKQSPNEEIISSSLSTALQLMETSRNDQSASSLNISISPNDREIIKKSLDNKNFSLDHRPESPVDAFLLNTERRASFEEGVTYASSDEVHNHNPDTFEAFDLEL